MKSILFYVAQDEPVRKRSYRLVRISPDKGVYIRTKIVSGDCASALDKAKPRKNEVFLNSVDLV